MTQKLQSFSAVQKAVEVPIMKYVTSQNKDLANKIGKLIIQVFNDAKHLTLSAHSWPSRLVASEIGNTFDMNKPFSAYHPSQFDLQYINPVFHRELIRAIVEAHLPSFRCEIQHAIAGSFRCDASMDRMQLDNQFELLKIVDHVGNESLKFIGIGHVTEAGAQGHLKAIRDGADETVGFESLLKCCTHMSTDGEAKHTGRHSGLWKLIDDERHKLGIDEVPMLKSVCAVHSSSLAFHDTCKSVTELKSLITELASLSTYFHTSARRTAELVQIVDAHGLTVRHLPSYYEVRWAEYSSSLLQAVLNSWRALVAYFTAQESVRERDLPQFKKSLTNHDKVKLMCFLADLLFLLANFQKKLQRDSLTIVDIKPELEVFTQKLNLLTGTPLIGGWEETFQQSVVNDNSVTTLYGH
jgi:hypothetical protein